MFLHDTASYLEEKQIVPQPTHTFKKKKKKSSLISTKKARGNAFGENTGSEQNYHGFSFLGGGVKNVFPKQNISNRNEDLCLITSIGLKRKH